MSVSRLIIILHALIISARPNTWIRIWGEMIVGAALAANPHINLTTFGFTFLAASPLLWTGGYMLNDVTDVKLDKEHPYRKTRPIANGSLSPTIAIGIIIVLACLAFIIGAAISTTVVCLLLGLALSQMLYTIPPIRLKERPFFDIMINGVNSAVRFFLGWYSQQPTHTFSFFPIGMFVALKLALFLGHRLQNRILEQHHHMKSTVVLLPKKITTLLIGLFILLAGMCYVLSVITNIFPLTSLFSFISFLPLAIIIVKNKSTLVTQEKSLHFRTYLYISYFIWTNILAAFLLFPIR